jgi:hypothetical protein
MEPDFATEPLSLHCRKIKMEKDKEYFLKDRYTPFSFQKIN